ncbi:uncharacterized protein LOC129940609 [Eupeodes corollae]|uniref:uncharacterized protein LOC129940609 n=1 Tax=Eupeodes corollae TaxID=290404 RepID=UPI002491A84F|nr:uncharacterized protein LOC129940609 [Eupeodes corollae]
MSNDPIEFLDSVLQAEELRWRMEEYGHDKTKYSISRSGRYKSLNKKRDALKPELYKGTDLDKKTKDNSSPYQTQTQQTSQPQQQSRGREREPKYTKFYETNL